MICSLSRCKTQELNYTSWFGNKTQDNDQMNWEAVVPAETHVTDVLFENTITTFKNISYEKHLTFWSFGSHFNIYLRLQPLFHPEMTVMQKTGRNIDIHIPVFYTGFNHDAFLSIVHGRFHNNDFKGILRWNNVTIEIDCPHANIVKRYVLLCKINAFKFDTSKAFDSNIRLNFKNTKWKYVKKRKKKKKYRKYRRQAHNKRRSCSVHIVADHLYFKYVGSLNFGSTVEAMTYTVAIADTIFRSTDFDGDGYGDNIGFVIENITIFTNPFDPHYHLNMPQSVVLDYLHNFSMYDFSGYCLGVAFTYRDFKKGVVGLSWVASSDPHEISGGICQHIRKDNKGLNTLLITQLNDNRFYPSYRAALALTHEFGHSFGAIHDKTSDTNCVPNNEYGNYIMYEFVIPGDKPNNRLFSPCSKERINPVIRHKGNCLKIDRGPVCGNGIREDGEECDCGTIGTCRYDDPCCTPSDIKNATYKPCTFIQGKSCSPKYSACCSDKCVPVQFKKIQICKPETECARASYCDGVNAICPEPDILPNGTVCNYGRQRCEKGICLKSICEYLKLKDCLCRSEHLYCHVCCKKYYSSDDTCAPVHTFAHAPNDTMNLRTQKGQPCNAYTGYCNVRHECITGSSNDIPSIVDTFLSKYFQENIYNWLMHYWLYVFGGCMCSLGTVILFVVTYKKRHDKHIEALMVAKLTNVLHEALLEKKKYWGKMESFQKKIDNRIKQVMHGKDIDSVEAVGRLSVLFPTASVSLLLETTKCSACEEAAVRILLMRGLPMQTFCVSTPNDSEHCLLQIEPKETP